MAVRWWLVLRSDGSPSNPVRLWDDEESAQAEADRMNIDGDADGRPYYTTGVHSPDEEWQQHWCEYVLPVAVLTEPWHWCKICGGELCPSDGNPETFADRFWCDTCNTVGWSEDEVNEMRAQHRQSLAIFEDHRPS